MESLGGDVTSHEVLTTGSESGEALEEISDDGTELNSSDGEETISDESDVSDEESSENECSSLSISQEQTEHPSQSSFQENFQNSDDDISNGLNNSSSQRITTDSRVSLQKSEKSGKSTVNSTGKTLKQIANSKQTVVSKTSKSILKSQSKSRNNPASSTRNISRQLIRSKNEATSKSSTNANKLQSTKNHSANHKSDISSHANVSLQRKNSYRKGSNDHTPSSERGLPRSGTQRNHKSQRHLRIQLPLPEVTETYPGGRLDFTPPIPKHGRPVLQSSKIIKTNMISKSDDHLMIDNPMSTRNAKSTGNLKHRPKGKAEESHAPTVKLSEGVVTLNERAKSFRNENRKLRGDTYLAAFNASSDTKVNKHRHHEPTRRKSFVRALHRKDGQKRSTGKGFMTTVGKVVPRDHSIVLIGQANMKDGKSVKTVVLGTLLIDDGKVGSGDSILTVSKNQKDLITGKRSLSRLPRHKRNASIAKDSTPPQKRVHLFANKVGKLMMLKGFTKNTATSDVSNSKLPIQQEKLSPNQPGKLPMQQQRNQQQVMQRVLTPNLENTVPKKLNKPTIPDTANKATPDFGFLRKKEENSWLTDKPITKIVADEQEAAFVQYDDPLLSNSDEDIDENMLVKRNGQVFTIGKSDRPRQISKAGKVLRKNILWQIPKGQDGCKVNGKALQRKMKGIRLEIRRTTDETSKGWVKHKSTRISHNIPKTTKYEIIEAAESGLNLPVIDYSQMSDIRDALIGLSYDSKDGCYKIKDKSGHFMYLRGEANHYDYIPSTKSVQSSVFHQALNGFVYIGSRIKNVIKKNGSQHYSGRDPSYDEIAPEYKEMQEGSCDVLDLTNQYSSDEFDSNSEISDGSDSSSDPSHKYDTPSSSDNEINNSHDSPTQKSFESSSGHQTNETTQSKTDTDDYSSGSSPSNKQSNSVEPTTEDQSTLMPSTGMAPLHSKIANGIRIQTPPQIVIGRRRGGAIFNSSPSNAKTPTASRPVCPRQRKSVGISPSCDSIYIRRQTSRKINANNGNSRSTKRQRHFERKNRSKKESQPHKSQSFHGCLPNIKKEYGFRASYDLTDGSCGDSIYNNGVMNKCESAKLNQSKAEGQTDQTKSHDPESIHKLQIGTPRISARHSSENSDKEYNVNSSHVKESRMMPESSSKHTILDSASYLPESSSSNNRYFSSSPSSTNSYSVISSSSNAGDDSLMASGETDSGSTAESKEDTKPAFIGKHVKETRGIETVTHYIHGTTCSNDNHMSHDMPSTSKQDCVSANNNSKISAAKSVKKMRIGLDVVSISTKYTPQSNLLHPSCNSKAAEKAERLDIKRYGEEYSNESSYEHNESDLGPDSWDVSVNSTNGIPSPVVVDERMKDFTDENTGSSQYYAVDECSAIATAGLGKRRPKGSKPIQKIRALLNYLRGDDLFLNTFLAKNNQLSGEDAKFRSEECCMMSKISPFDFTSILTGVSQKCGCIKRFEPFFEKLYEQNAYQPMAERIVDFSLYEGIKIHNQLHPLYTEEDIDVLCDKLVYKAITKGIAEFTVIQSISSTLLEIKSEDLLDNMTVEDVKGVVEEIVANVIADEAMEQGRRSVIVESFIRDSVPNVSARKTNRASLTPMYREAMKCAILEETMGSRKMESSKPAITSSDMQHDALMPERECCNAKSSHISKISSKIVRSATSMTKTELSSSSEGIIESPKSNISLHIVSAASKSNNDIPHPSGFRLKPGSSLDFQTGANAYAGKQRTSDMTDKMKSGISSAFTQRLKLQGDKFLSLCQKFDANAQSKLLQNEANCTDVDSKSNVDAIETSSRLHKTGSNKEPPHQCIVEHSSKLVDSEPSQLPSALHNTVASSIALCGNHPNEPGTSSSRSCGAFSNDGLGNGKWISKILDSDEELFDDEDADSFCPYPSSRRSTPHQQIATKDTGKSSVQQTSFSPRVEEEELREVERNEKDVVQAKPEVYSDAASATIGSSRRIIGRAKCASSVQSSAEDFSEQTLQRIDSAIEESSSQIANSSVAKSLNIPAMSTVEKMKTGVISAVLPTNSSVSPGQFTDHDGEDFPKTAKMKSIDLATNEAGLFSEMSQNREGSVDIKQRPITERPPAKLTTQAEYSRIGKRCHHPKIFLSCVHCRQALFKSTSKLRHQLYHRSDRHNSQRKLGKAKKMPQQSCQQQDSSIPFPSGGQLSSRQHRSSNDKDEAHHNKPGYDGMWTSSILNTASTSCSEYQYESSNREFSSESSYSLKGGPIIIGRGNAQFPYHFKPTNQLPNLSLQIGLPKAKSCDQAQLQSLYDNTSAYFLSCDQRIVIGGETTSEEDSASTKENTDTAVHPCGCNKSTEQSPISDQQLDGEKIVEKEHTMFRPHSPTIDDDDIDDETSDGDSIGDSNVKKQYKDSTPTDTADASVQTSARGMMTISSVDKINNSRSRRRNLTSSLDSDSNSDSFRPGKSTTTKKTRPLYSARSKSASSVHGKRLLRVSSDESLPSKETDRKSRKASVMNLFDELRNELNALGTIIDTSKIGKNRDAGILSAAPFKHESQVDVATSHQKEMHANSDTRKEIDNNKDTKNTDKEFRQVSFKTQNIQSTRSLTHDKVESVAGKPLRRNLIFTAFKCTPHVSAKPSPRGHKRLSRHDSYGGSLPKKLLGNQEKRVQKRTSKIGIKVVNAAVPQMKKPVSVTDVSVDRDGQQQRFFKHRMQIGKDRQRTPPGQQAADYAMNDILPLSERNVGGITDQKEQMQHESIHNNVSDQYRGKYGKTESLIIPKQAAQAKTDIVEDLDKAPNVDLADDQLPKNNVVKQGVLETRNSLDNCGVPQTTSARRPSVEVGRRSLVSNNSADPSAHPLQSSRMLDHPTTTPAMDVARTIFPDIRRPSFFSRPGMDEFGRGPNMINNAHHPNTANQNSNPFNNMQLHAPTNITINVSGNGTPEARRQSQEERRRSTIPRQEMKPTPSSSEIANQRKNSMMESSPQPTNLLTNAADESIETIERSKAADSADFRRQSTENRRQSVLSKQGMNGTKRHSQDVNDLDQAMIENTNNADTSIVPDNEARRQSDDVRRQSVLSNRRVDDLKRPSQVGSVPDYTTEATISSANMPTVVPKVRNQSVFSNQDTEERRRSSNLSRVSKNEMPETDDRRYSLEVKRQSVSSKRSNMGGTKQPLYSGTVQSTSQVNTSEIWELEARKHSTEMSRQSVSSKRSSMAGTERPLYSGTVQSTSQVDTSGILALEARKHSAEMSRQSVSSKRSSMGGTKRPLYSGAVQSTSQVNTSGILALEARKHSAEMSRQSVSSKRSSMGGIKPPLYSEAVQSTSQVDRSGILALEARKHSAKMSRQSIISNQTMKNMRRQSQLDDTQDYASAQVMNADKRNSVPESIHSTRQSVIPEDVDTSLDEDQENEQEISSSTKRPSRSTDTLDQDAEEDLSDLDIDNVPEADEVRRSMSTTTTTSSEEMPARLPTNYSSDGIPMREPTHEEAWDGVHKITNPNADSRYRVESTPQHIQATAEMKVRKPKISRNRGSRKQTGQYVNTVNDFETNSSNSNEYSLPRNPSFEDSSDREKNFRTPLRNASLKAREERSYGLLDSCVHAAFPSKLSVLSTALHDRDQNFINRRKMFPEMQSHINLPSKKSRDKRAGRRHKHRNIPQRCCREDRSSSEDSTDHYQYLEEKKWQRRVKLQRKISKSCTARWQESSILNILRRIFSSDDIQTSAFETLIRIGAVLVIVIYAMHEEIFDYGGDFPT